MTVHTAVQVSAGVNPPVAAVSEEYVEVSVTLRIRGDFLTEHHPRSAHIVGVLVGQPTAGVSQAIASELPIRFVDGDGRLKSIVETAVPCASLSDALERFSDWVSKNEIEGAHLLIFVSRSTIENGDRLGDRVETLRNHGGRADVFGTTPSLDFRLLGQVALMSGGRFYVGERRWLKDAGDCLRRQKERRFYGARLGITLTSNLIPVNAFRLDPAPLHLRDFQVQPASQTCWFDLPEMSSSQDETTWLLRCLAPRKKAGEYRLLDYQLVGQTAAGPVTMTGTVAHMASASPAESSQVDARVEVEVDKARATHWVESVGQAYVRGDGGKIVSTFAPFMQHESLNGRPENAARLWSLKGELIRGGYFGLKELNTLWCLAQGVELDASD